MEVGPKKGQIEEKGKEKNPPHEDQFILTRLHEHVPEDVDKSRGQDQSEGIDFHVRSHGEIFPPYMKKEAECQE
jgi:hypothetical protein